MENKKKNLNVIINIELVDEFLKLCDVKSVSKSKLIENYIKKWIEENK